MEDAATTRFRELFRTQFPYLLAYFRRRLSDAAEAEDLAAETFAIAWRRLGDAPDAIDQLPWLYGVARRVLSNQRRSRQRREALLERLTSQPPRDPYRVDSAVEWREELERVVHALRQLSQDEQEILTLVAWEGLSVSQLAIGLGCSQNAASIRLHRARRRLADLADRHPVSATAIREANY